MDESVPPRRLKGTTVRVASLYRLCISLLVLRCCGSHSCARHWKSLFSLYTHTYFLIIIIITQHSTGLSAHLLWLHCLVNDEESGAWSVYTSVDMYACMFLPLSSFFIFHSYIPLYVSIWITTMLCNSVCPKSLWPWPRHCTEKGCLHIASKFQ